MRDGVADVLAERAALDRGAGAGVLVSILLHAALTGVAVYSALHAPAPKPVTMVNIQFAGRQMPAGGGSPRTAARKPAKAPAPRLEETQPKIEEPKPEITKPAQKPEKNTVPLSPFGRSTKKGSETPAVTPAKPSAPAGGAIEGGAAGVGIGDVPIGGSGVTGLEGGDFPYSLYIDGMQRKIGGNWFRPTVSGGTTTVVYFRIQRDGTIVDARVETPSGNSTFDRAALSAVRSANPLNPLPFAYSGSYLGVHLTFR